MPRILVVLLLMSLSMLSPAQSLSLPPGEPGAGVSQALAHWRASHYRGLRYALRIEIPPTYERLRGALHMQWQMAQQVDLVLDWLPPAGLAEGPAHLANLRVNGQPVEALIADEHLRIPAASLRRGDNVLEVEFDSPIATARTAITRYIDGTDASTYLYSLLVPADASSVFPCIDQPDLKARFDLEIGVPLGNEVVANAPLRERIETDGKTIFRFAATPPISTYLFAFAVGPFVQLTDARSGHRLFVRRSQQARARAEVEEVMWLNREAVHYFERLFAQPFPFAKYDLVLLPEFAYGGMEHAGATFLREDAVLFPFEPAATDLLRRAQLIFHEASHQWFGDLVTMRWFDDLWLKEGFANLMAMRAAQALLPQLDARNAFRALKLSAYRTDVTAGTTPIWQALPNLSAAKSAYGSIVYSKAPAVLDQLAHYIGEPAFITGVRTVLARHAFGNASWEDLIAELEASSGESLQEWARIWVRRPGLPRVEPIWQIDNGRIVRFVLRQSALPSGLPDVPEFWPQRVDLLLVYPDGSRKTLEVQMRGTQTEVGDAVGLPAPQFVFANAGDRGYGIFVLDAISREAVIEQLGTIDNSVLRAQLWDALWEAVREGQLAARRWIDLALRRLPMEDDDITVSGLLNNLQTALRWYLNEGARDAVQSDVETMLRERMLDAPTLSLRIAYFRAFVSMARSRSARETLTGLLDGRLEIPGLSLRSIDRFRIIRSLLALDDAQAEQLLSAQRSADP